MTNFPRKLAEDVLGRPRPLLLAFDIDGTLAPYHLDPDLARVPSDVVKALRSIHRVRGITVALITGRAFPSMNRVIRLPEVWRSAEHGAVVVKPGAIYKKASLTKNEARAMRAFDNFAKRELLPLGAMMERKPRARAVHTRKMSQKRAELGRELLRRTRAEILKLGLHPRDGSYLIEAELDKANKGDALKHIATKTKARTIYFAGDDLTDLPGLEIAHQRSGLGLFVRSEKRKRRPAGTSASFRDISASLEFVRTLADLAKR